MQRRGRKERQDEHKHDQTASEHLEARNRGTSKHGIVLIKSELSIVSTRVRKHSRTLAAEMPQSSQEAETFQHRKKKKTAKDT